MHPRESDSDTTLRFPKARTPEAKTLRISRFEQPSEPKLQVAHILEREMMEEDTLVERYRSIELLGRGGMGEVNRSLDTRIGREVAIKTMRVEEGQGDVPASRFLREARVQALLEHPAIVPVYDIGFEHGTPYFAMKRVRGETLLDILERTRTLSKTQRANVTRHRLLSAFVTVCLAMDYAHERGVVHRDLKPDNIMLGAHGEVYVLDWGVAKVLPPKAGMGRASTADMTTDDGDETRPGDMVGTPGYMSPEQVLGQLEMVDGQSDIYGLGAILYELLTQEPLIPGATAHAILEATLDPNRAPPPPRDVPPELYVLCLRATRFQKEERPRSAREMAEAIERYLDGDRDEELRRRLADERAVEAKELASRALDGPREQREAARAQAMRLAGRALALAPEHETARAVVLRLFAAPPETMPADAQRERDKLHDRQLNASMRDNVVRTAIWVAMFPLLVFLGIKIGWLAGVVLALNVACVATAAVLFRKRITSSGARLGLFGLVVILGMVLTGIFGPLMFVPGFTAVNTVLFGAQASKKHRPWVIAMGCAVVALPLALELLGVLPPSMRFDGDAITILPRISGFSEGAALVALTLVSLLGVVAPTLLAARLRDALLALDEQLVIQKWHLSQLAPARLGRDG